jgi:glutaconate CoA-transferase, subunit A
MKTYPDIQHKLMTAEQAVRTLIRDGMQIAIGGFTINRNPMAIVYEVIRQGIKDLDLACHSNGQALDLLVGAGSVRRVEIAYAGNGRFAPTCIRFRKAVERREIEFEDYSNYQMSLRFLAGALGIPFIPTKSGLGTSILSSRGFSSRGRTRRKTPIRKLITAQNPFNRSRDPVVLLPALTPDVAIIHAQYVGEDGTVRVKGLTFADIEQAKSADRVIVSCEKIVPRSWIRNDPDQNSIPSFMVDAIVKAPYGAHPTACGYFYDYDPAHLNMYKRVATDDRSFFAYLKEWIHGAADHEAYLKKIGGTTLRKIRADLATGYATGLDRR